MATSGTVTISGSLNNNNISIENLAISVSIPAGIYASTLVTLVSGNNTITIPTGTTLIIIELPAANAVATALKWATGDGNTGLMAPAGGIVMIQITSSSPPTSFVLNAASNHTQATTIKFI